MDTLEKAYVLRAKAALDMMTENSAGDLPKGRVFVRSLIARGLVGPTGSEEHIRGCAVTRWGAYHADAIVKSAVSALTSGDTGTDSAKAEFFNLVRERSVLGQMQDLRKVPFNVRMLAVTAGARGYWVGQANSKPLSKPTLTGSTLAPLKVASIIVVTKEMLQSTDPTVEATLQDDLVRAVTTAMDEALLDPDNAGIANEVPASLANGATQIASTSDFGADLRAMVEAFQGDFGTAYFVSSPAVFTKIATMTDSGGRYVFANIGPRGGSLLGIPAIASQADAQTTSGSQLSLIDAAGIASAMEDLGIEVTDAASLQMSDDPDDSGSPVELVSLFQTNSVAYKAEVMANWSRQRPGSVVVLEGL